MAPRRERHARRGRGVVFPHGPDAIGYLLYSAGGFMSVAVMRAGRPAFASLDPYGGTDDEKARAFESHISYAGRYEIDGDRVIHYPEVGSFPNWNGGRQERCFTIEGDTLTLTTSPGFIGGQLRAGRLVWRRAGA